MKHIQKCMNHLETRFLFADNIEVERMSRVLEIGTGMGIIAIISC